jgi:hypothetical protein
MPEFNVLIGDLMTFLEGSAGVQDATAEATERHDRRLPVIGGKARRPTLLARWRELPRRRDDEERA